MRYGSVCSGIESATVAWHPLGWTPAFFAEIEPFPSAVLAHHYPDVPNLGDFAKITESDVEPIELLVGGTPCQSFSVAGKRLGMDDPRGNLALEFVALARRLRPRWLVWENVPGVHSSLSGSEQTEREVREGDVGGRADGIEDRDFAAFLSALLECGYCCAWRVLDAQYVRVEPHPRAVPQRRRRVFVVGYFGDWRPAAAVLLEPEGLRGDSPPRREAGKGAAGSVKASLERCSADEAECDTLIAFGGNNTEGGTGHGDFESETFAVEVSPTLRSGGNRTGGDRPPVTDVDTCETLIPCVADPISASEANTYTHEGNGNFRLHNCVAFDPTQITHPENRSRPQDLSPQLTESGYAPAIAFSCKDHGADATEESAPTLRAMGHDKTWENGGGQVAVAFKASHFTRGKDGAPADVAAPLSVEADYGDQDPLLLTCAAVRRLTPRECERLQGFPDDYTLVRYRGKPAADGPRYKALGNAMACNCMRWIGARISLFERTVLRRNAA